MTSYLNIWVLQRKRIEFNLKYSFEGHKLDLESENGANLVLLKDFQIMEPKWINY